MSQETLSPAKQQVKEQTHKALSKYNTKQLQEKIETNKLMGLSREVALEILKKRGVEIQETAAPVVETPKKSKPVVAEIAEVEEEEAPSTPEIEEVKEKVEKPKKAKKEKVEKPKVTRASSIESINAADPEVKVILNNELLKKSEKIGQLLDLGFTPLQVSKKYFPELNAHYSQVHQVFKNREDGKV